MDGITLGLFPILLFMGKIWVIFKYILKILIYILNDLICCDQFVLENLKSMFNNLNTYNLNVDINI